MSEKINIQAGVGIRKILSTTLPLNKALTELIKNSIQNNATWIDIKLNKSNAIITDNGSGFDDKKDSSGYNEFEKYFVFGNSSENNTELNLGAMGVGGKIANDKLSDINNTHWEIHSKNYRNKYSKVTFKTENEDLLTDISPYIENLDIKKCPIKSKTGTQIIIKTLNEQIRNKGWEKESIKKEIQLFFNLLITQLKESNKNFSITLNGEKIKFTNTLEGQTILKKSFKFNYTINSKQLIGKVDAQLNTKEGLMDTVDVFSYTRVGPFRLNLNQVLVTAEKFNLNKKFPFASAEKVFQFFNQNLCGILSCREIQDCKSEDGITAKDLSHHRLNPDHPLTKAFNLRCIEEITKAIWPIVNKRDNPELRNTRILNQVGNIIKNSFDIPESLLTEKQTTKQKKIKS